MSEAKRVCKQCKEIIQYKLEVKEVVIPDSEDMCPAVSKASKLQTLKDNKLPPELLPLWGSGGSGYATYYTCTACAPDLLQYFTFHAEGFMRPGYKNISIFS